MPQPSNRNHVMRHGKQHANSLHDVECSSAHLHLNDAIYPWNMAAFVVDALALHVDLKRDAVSLRVLVVLWTS